MDNKLIPPSYLPLVKNTSLEQVNSFPALAKATKDSCYIYRKKIPAKYTYRQFTNDGIFEKENSVNMLELGACKFHQATISGKSGVITSDEAYAGMSFGPTMLRKKFPRVCYQNEYNIHVIESETGEFLLRQAKRIPRTFVPGKTLLLTSLRDEFFSHFLFECLSILSVAELLDCEFNVVVSPYIAPYQIEMIQACGIHASRIIRKSLAEDLVCEELFVINAPGKNNSWITSPAMRFIRDKFINYAKPYEHIYRSDFRKCDRYYIDRQDDRSGMRTIENETELKEIAARYGFRAVTPGKLDLRQKVFLFQQAKYIIGQYGGGMQFALNGRKGANLLVIQSPLFTRYQMSIMKYFLNHNVINIHGKKSVIDVKEYNNAPFYVDPKTFEESVKYLLQPKDNAPQIADPMDRVAGPIDRVTAKIASIFS